MSDVVGGPLSPDPVSPDPVSPDTEALFRRVLDASPDLVWILKG
jgi:hypothetical protein